MKPELTTMMAQGLALLLLVGAAGASEQVITPDPLQRFADPNQSVAFTVGYETANPCSDHLTGLGLRIHWDSSRLAFVSLAAVSSAALVAQGPVEDDGANADADPATDKFVQVAWADMDGVWSGGGCAVANLYTANFLTLPGPAGSTSLRFSASSTAAGYTFSALAATVTLNSYTLTVNQAGTGNGTVGGAGSYAAGDPVTLTATPAVGSTFAGWGPSPCAASFTMPATDLTCTATFSLPALKINNVRKAEGNSGTTAYTFTITLSPASTGTVKVKYATANGTARAGSDYTAIPATLLAFSPGQTSKQVTVNVSGDTIPEANETFYVNLSAAKGATLFDGQGKGTLLNDEGPVLKINNVSKAEGNSGTTAYTFIVTLSPASTGSVTVKYATANGTATAGSDYTAIPATLLTFSPGQTSKPVTVQVTGDTTPEANETFFVKLGSARGATLFDGQGKGTLLNDDLGQVPDLDEVAEVGEVTDVGDGSEVDEGSDLSDVPDLDTDSEQGR